MIGLTFLAIFAVLLIGYFWLLRATVRYAKRKTGSNVIAALAVLGVLVLTFGDTIFNRWYHKEVLCKRDDVGVKIFATAELPPEYWDDIHNKPNLPTTMMFGTNPKPFLDRYVAIDKYEYGGTFPFTAYEMNKLSTVDLKTGQTLSQFIDYTPAGGTWWAWPLKFLGENNMIGWVLSRGSVTWCGINNQRASDAVDSIRHAFKKTLEGQMK